MINWSEVLEEYNTSEGKLRVIMEIVMNIIEVNCKKFKNQGNSKKIKIPRDRRILLRKNKKLKLKFRCKLSSERKNYLEQAIRNIDKKN